MILQDEEENFLSHYGILRKSGRYPWGSGGNADTDTVGRSKDFFVRLAELRSQGLSDSVIANGWGMTTTELRNTTSIANAEIKAAKVSEVYRLKEKSYSNVAIGEKLGIPEATVRDLLKPGVADRVNIIKATTDMLRDEVDANGYIDVGKGTEYYIGGVSKERKGTAIAILKAEGYVVHNVQVPTSTQNKTTIKVLAPPGTTYKDIVTNIGAIKSLTKVSDDGGRSFYGMLPPLPISSDRVSIRYKDEGGDLADGVIYVRPGVKDVSLAGARYAQVRIDVDGTHYLKGMAVYKNDLPDGVDLQFNTNKPRTANKLDAMKPKTDDIDNPFGAVVDQIGIRNPQGHLVELTSVMNVVNEEGDWDKWSRNLSSQTLSKQSSTLAKTQLNMTYERKKNELDGIMALTNPAVKRKLLESYADAADASSIQLKAAALPRSSWHAILPISGLKENEVYAPNFRPGETVALIRYPHGGTFEIPELTVNNSHRGAKSILGRAQDAIGINAKVAERLSGADFDGDAVLVIPNNNRSIKTTPALAGLKNFDPRSEYPKYEGMPVMTPKIKGQQMGMVSNLIADMTIQRASTSEIAAAIRHSMVVIDAENHELNYKLSAINNGIRNLQKKYQPRDDGRYGGASTLISRAKSRVDVRARRPRPMSKGGPIDKATGRKMYENIGDPYLDKNGKTVYPRHRSVKLKETDDAHTLSSGTLIEKVYADHSNKLKALANTARKEAVAIPSIKVQPSAKRVYAAEVKSLTAKLDLAQRNSPRERQAQILTASKVAAKRQANPDLDETQVKRIRSQALDESRRRTGAKKPDLTLTDREWQAIQAGAITQNKLKGILDNANIEQVKALATPRTALLMSSAKTSRARAMTASGYSQAEIAAALGVSLTTLKEGLK